MGLNWNEIKSRALLFSKTWADACNEASGKAAVHCVTVGFGPGDQAVKTIYEYEDIKGLPHAVPAKRINAYLLDASDVLLRKRRTPICQVHEMSYGSKPTDGGRRPSQIKRICTLPAVWI